MWKGIEMYFLFGLPLPRVKTCAISYLHNEPHGIGNHDEAATPYGFLFDIIFVHNFVYCGTNGLVMVHPDEMPRQSKYFGRVAPLCLDFGDEEVRLLNALDLVERALNNDEGVVSVLGGLVGKV